MNECLERDPIVRVVALVPIVISILAPVLTLQCEVIIGCRAGAAIIVQCEMAFGRILSLRKLILGTLGTVRQYPPMLCGLMVVRARQYTNILLAILTARRCPIRRGGAAMIVQCEMASGDRGLILRTLATVRQQSQIVCRLIIGEFSLAYVSVLVLGDPITRYDRGARY